MVTSRPSRSRHSGANASPPLEHILLSQRSRIYSSRHGPQGLTFWLPGAIDADWEIMGNCQGGIDHPLWSAPPRLL